VHVDNRTLEGARIERVHLTSLCDENFTRTVPTAASVRYAAPFRRLDERRDRR